MPSHKTISLLLAGLLALAIIGTLATSAQAQSSSSTPGGFSSTQANPNTGVTTSTTISGTAYGGETTSYQGLECQHTVEDPSLIPGTRPKDMNKQRKAERDRRNHTSALASAYRAGGD